MTTGSGRLAPVVVMDSGLSLREPRNDWPILASGVTMSTPMPILSLYQQSSVMPGLRVNARGPGIDANTAVARLCSAPVPDGKVDVGAADADVLEKVVRKFVQRSLVSSDRHPAVDRPHHPAGHPTDFAEDGFITWLGAPSSKG
jgi:hypothetical protein